MAAVTEISFEEMLKWALGEPECVRSAKNPNASAAGIIIPFET
ncbi:hypothetical protein [Bradyrhizobium quebecense]|nr:hypothetical protein [Bradyrhizobium quebecense]